MPAGRVLRASGRRLAVALDARSGGVFGHHLPPGAALHLGRCWSAL